MAREPINIFSWKGDPTQVRSLLLTWFPDAVVFGDSGDDWAGFIVTFDNGSALRILHNSDYYAGPDWPKQVAGMQGYFSRFPLGDREAQTMATIGSFRFALATQFEPDYDPNGDERLSVVMNLTEVLDGVIFTPSSLRDPSGRVLVSSDGEVDADAVWPLGGRTAPARGFGEKPADADDGWTKDPPTAERVAARAVATMILTARAVLERDHDRDPNCRANLDRLREWARELGVEGEFEPWERTALGAELGKLDGQTATDAMWRIEGLTVLAWALGVYDLLPYDEISDVDGVWDAVGFFNTGQVTGLLSSPTLRPAEQLDAYRKQMLAYHWRLREHTVRPETMDFAEFSRTGWIGPFDGSIFTLIDGDLALMGERIDRAARGVFSKCRSIAAERHLAANWLCWGPAVYSAADRST